MFDLGIIDVGIGLMTVYLLLGLICTAVNELVSHAFNLRARTLAEGIKTILNEAEAKELTRALYNHPLIKSLYRNGKKPAYIPSSTFATVLLDLITRDNVTGQIRDIKTAVDDIENPHVKHILSIVVENADSDMQKIHEGVKQWYNDTIDRVSGWYKRQTQVVVIIISAIITFLTNADTVSIATALASDATVRQLLVAESQTMVQQPSTSPISNPSLPKTVQPVANIATTSSTEAVKQDIQNINRLMTDIGNLNLPLGWDKKNVPISAWAWVTKIVGLLITALAASLGAPFWFDTLNKVTNIRSAGPPPPKT